MRAKEVWDMLKLIDDDKFDSNMMVIGYKPDKEMEYNTVEEYKEVKEKLKAVKIA